MRHGSRVTLADNRFHYLQLCIRHGICRLGRKPFKTKLRRIAVLFRQIRFFCKHLFPIHAGNRQNRFQFPNILCARRLYREQLTACRAALLVSRNLKRNIRAFCRNASRLLHILLNLKQGSIITAVAYCHNVIIFRSRFESLDKGQHSSCRIAHNKGFAALNPLPLIRFLIKYINIRSRINRIVCQGAFE